MTPQTGQISSVPSEAALRRLFELSRDLLFVLDRDGRFVHVNPAALDLLGWPVAELLQRSFLEGVVSEDRARVADEFQRLQHETGPARFDAGYLTKMGRPVTLSWIMSAEADHVHAVGSCQRHPVRERVEDAAFHAKTEFLASMNHELRTPLNAILGYTDLLEGDSSLFPKQRDALRSIKRSSEHLLLLISDILDFAKLDANKLILQQREFLVADFLDLLTELFVSRAHKKNISFVHQQTTPLPVAVRADETRLRQVLLNLLSNAVKFTERGGVVLRTGFDGTRLCFAVEDTGIGIPPSYLEAIFHPFEQIPHQQAFTEGMGIGLALSRHLVHLMGGTLRVKSEPGRGSTFWFEVEVEQAIRWPRERRPTEPIAGYEGPEIKLLVVDDHAESRAFFARVLGEAGFQVREAENGRDAVVAAKADPPDLVLMDLVMPVMDGFSAIRELRATPGLERIPVLAISASAMAADDGTAGYDGFLRKPVSADELFTALAEHLDIVWFYGTAHSGEWTAATLESAASAAVPEAEDSGEHTLGREQLRAIHDAATIGDIREILSILEDAGFDAEADPPGDALAAEIHQLAKEFRSRQIKERVKAYLP